MVLSRLMPATALVWLLLPSLAWQTRKGSGKKILLSAGQGAKSSSGKKILLSAKKISTKNRGRGPSIEDSLHSVWRENTLQPFRMLDDLSPTAPMDSIGSPIEPSSAEGGWFDAQVFPAYLTPDTFPRDVYGAIHCRSRFLFCTGIGYF